MVHEIIRQHNRKIDVSGEVGFGTTFHIYLPVSLIADNYEDNVTSKLEGGQETILLAEDDDMVRAIAKRYLETAGYEVVEATNGQKAVDIFKIHKNELSLLKSESSRIPAH